MKSIFEFQEKKEKLIIGVLSGTSIDGLDIVLVSVKDSGINTKLKVLNFKTFLYDDEYRNLILKVSDTLKSNVEDVCKINFLTGIIFADKINEFISLSGYRNSDIDIIGSHGQTIYHIPTFTDLSGYKFKSTLQIGEPSVIANKTGITTIGDFRVADVAVNGDGAPLVPYLDFLLFRNEKSNRVLINIGGISNLTYLNADCNIENVLAFDTGPGNMIIDHYMKKLFGLDYDESGKTAESGHNNNDLFTELINNDNYIKKIPPKSTGRERYGTDVQNTIDRFIGFITQNDIIRTITDYTVYSICDSIKNFIYEYQNIDDILLSGGGAKNNFIKRSIEREFSGMNVRVIDDCGINTDNKEAVLFAVLANETMNLNYSNITQVTGAEKNVILGKICPVRK